MFRLLSALFVWLIITLIALPSGAQRANLLYGLVARGEELVLLAVDLNDASFSQELLRFSHNSEKRLRAFFQLTDGSLAFADAAVKKNVAALQRSTLTTLGTPNGIINRKKSDTPKGVSGLNQIESLHGAIAANPTSLISLTGHFTDTPPYSLALVQPKTGQIKRRLSTYNLPPMTRYSNLTQCPSGQIYATSLSQSQGGTRLVRLDLKQKEFVDIADLHFNLKGLEDDLSSLACSPSGQIFALGDLAYQGVNALFTIDMKTGDLQMVRVFDVDKITFNFTLKPKDDNEISQKR